jgi:hypothetical protein
LPPKGGKKNSKNFSKENPSQGVAFKLLRGKESLLNFSVASTSLLNVKVGSLRDSFSSFSEKRVDFVNYNATSLRA